MLIQEEADGLSQKSPARFTVFLLDKRSFFIACVGFGDKTIIFAV